MSAWFYLGHSEYNDAVAAGWALIINLVFWPTLIGSLALYDYIKRR